MNPFWRFFFPFPDPGQPHRLAGNCHFGTKWRQIILPGRMPDTRPIHEINGDSPEITSAKQDCSFRAGPLVNLPALIESLGADPVEVFGRSGFSPDDFSDPDQRAPYLRASYLLADCLEATGCERIGLLLGEQASSSHLGIPGFLVHAAPNCRVALKALAENIDLHDEAGTVTLDIGEEYTLFGYAIKLEGVKSTEIIYDLAATMICKIMQTLCGEDWHPTTVKLPRREPADAEYYRRFFSSTVYFDATECEVSFPSHLLQKKSPGANRLLFEHLSLEARELHALKHHELMEELPAALRRGLMTEQFAARQIAEMFGMHERTLHRRLRAAGTSFRRELDRARQSVSEQLLEGTSLPVCDIANALGYADSSGFIRAFQRWSGSTPNSWRKLNGPQVQNR